MSTKFEIGCLQLAPALGDREATIAKIERLLDGKQLPKVLVLPELCNSGYNFASPEQARELAEPVTDSPFLDFLGGICRESGSFIVTGLNELDGDRLYNTAVLLGPEGVVGKYRKMHLFLNEKDIFTPGDAGLPVFDLGFCRVGMLICFDWIFPEVWRILALKGADIICHSSNLVLPGLAQKGTSVHALINGYYIALANRNGKEGELTFTGLSQVGDPRGEILAAVDAVAETMLAAPVDIDLARDKIITTRNDRLADRRPEEYRALIDN